MSNVARFRKTDDEDLDPPTPAPSGKESKFSRIVKTPNQISVTNNTIFKGFILPGYDWSYSISDTAFGEQHLGYRTEDGEFSAFYLTVPCYVYYGNTKAKFVSPKARGKMATVSESGDVPDTHDPIFDLHKFLTSGKPGSEKYQNLLANISSKQKAPVRKPDYRCLLNCYGKQGPHAPAGVFVIDISTPSYFDLKDQLDTVRPTGFEIVDPNFKNFVLGDVTDPTRSSLFYIRSKEMTASGGSFRTGGIEFVEDLNDEKSVIGIHRADVVKQLPNRYNFWLDDKDNVLNIPSYQEIIELLIEDNLIPVELIKHVCGHTADITPQRTPVPEPVKQVPVRQEAANPAPTPKQEEPKFWYFIKGVIDSPQEATVRELQSKIDAGHLNLQVLDSNNSWISKTKLTSIGLKLPSPKPVAAPTPPPPPPPVVEDDDVPAGYVPPKTTPVEKKPDKPKPPEPATVTTQDSQEKLSEDDLRILDKGYTMMESGQAIQATPEFSAVDCAKFVSLFVTHDRNGNLK